jgi:hypothetical protein
MKGYRERHFSCYSRRVTFGIGFDNGWDDYCRLDCQRYGTNYYLFLLKSTFA